MLALLILLVMSLSLGPFLLVLLINLFLVSHHPFIRYVICQIVELKVAFCIVETTVFIGDAILLEGALLMASL